MTTEYGSNNLLEEEREVLRGIINSPTKVIKGRYSDYRGDLDGILRSLKTRGLIFYKSGEDEFVVIMKKKIDREYVREMMEYEIVDWLRGFNTNSATDCFTAVQELKKKWEIDI